MTTPLNMLVRPEDPPMAARRRESSSRLVIRRRSGILSRKWFCAQHARIPVDDLVLPAATVLARARARFASCRVGIDALEQLPKRAQCPAGALAQRLAVYTIVPTDPLRPESKG